MNYDEILVCKFSIGKSKHFYEKPKLLPCYNSACERCILNVSNEEGKFKCKFCFKLHAVSEIKIKLGLDKILKDNLNGCVEIKISECKEVMAILKGKKLVPKILFARQHCTA
jgi:hypothetical protein